MALVSSSRRKPARSLLSVVLILISTALVLGGCSEDPPVALYDQQVQARQAILTFDELTQGKGQISHMFEGPDNLLGIVGSNAGHEFVVWASPSGKHLLAGPLINEAGENLTLSYEIHYLGDKYLSEDQAKTPTASVEPEAERSARIAKRETEISKAAARWFEDVKLTSAQVTGSGDRHLYVFIEPFCPYCHNLYAELADAEDLRIHWIPVGFMRENSSRVAAAILAPDTGAATLDAVMRQRSTTESDDADLRRQVAFNRSVFDASMHVSDRAPATPLIAFETGDGQVEMLYGAGADFHQRLSRIAVTSR